jgi:hypothetical protein
MFFIMAVAGTASELGLGGTLALAAMVECFRLLWGVNAA